MKCLVTGGAGFIGSHIAEELLAQGHKVFIIDNLSSGYQSNIPEGAIFINDDISNINLWKQKLGDLDVIFHNAASKKNICLKDPVRDAEVNTIGTLQLLKFAYENGVKKFVHASTGSVYGEQVALLREWLHPQPVSYYGVSKANGEQYVQYFNKKGLNTTILRYFHVYGKRQESQEDLGGVVSIFIDKMRKGEPVSIYGTGYQERSFTYVKDVVKANLLVAELPQTNGEIYNCASGIRVNIKFLLAELRKYLPSVGFVQKDRMEGDIDNFFIDNTKIRELGIEFTPFSEGIKLTL